MTLSLNTATCMDASWHELLKEEFEKPYMLELQSFLDHERELHSIYPPAGNVFDVFSQSSFNQVKVVIVGQDPYHGTGQAHGLAFSVQKGVPIPPSLRNIFKEINGDLGVVPPNHGCLNNWAKQGVFLLNTTLTVEQGKPKSHYGRGWETFTDTVVQLLSRRKDPIVFILWGKSAYDKFHQISSLASHHCILGAPHPSPLSAHAGFFGCHHFSKTNEFLQKVGKKPINWDLNS